MEEATDRFLDAMVRILDSTRLDGQRTGNEVRARPKRTRWLLQSSTPQTLSFVSNLTVAVEPVSSGSLEISVCAETPWFPLPLWLWGAAVLAINFSWPLEFRKFGGAVGAIGAAAALLYVTFYRPTETHLRSLLDAAKHAAKLEDVDR